jgi:hypothetical protein
MTNQNAVMRELVNIDPLFSPTRSVEKLVGAVAFVEAQLREKGVNISANTAGKFTDVRRVDRNMIIARPSESLDLIHFALLALQQELPATEDLQMVRVPESVEAMRLVTSVIALANSLLSIIRGLSLLPATE